MGNTVPFTVTAIIAAYNEADIIHQVVGDLVRQRVSVYLMDHGSTDGTATAAEPYLGHGLIAIERFPPGPADGPGGGRVSWEVVLHRKEELAAELDADWFIHHDADEFRESPWPHLDLVDAIRQVDLFGYNAIDFELLNFWPTHDGWRPGDDVRAAFPCYEPGAAHDKVQIRCWKKGVVPVDLASSGGHEAVFPSRKVFPLRFILRHYPIRGQSHGRRKVFGERRARFLESEFARGWHIQYDGLREDQSLLRDAATLTPYEPAAVRLQLVLNHRGVEDLLQTPAARQREMVEARRELDRLGRELHHRDREVARLGEERDARHRELVQVTLDLDRCNREAERLRQDLESHRLRIMDLRLRVAAACGRAEELGVRLASADATAARLLAEVQEGARRLQAVLDSRSWRWSAPLRAVARALRRRRRA